MNNARITSLRSIAQTDTRVVRTLLVVAAVALVISGQVLLTGNIPEESESFIQGVAGVLFLVGTLMFGALMPNRAGIKLIPRLEFPHGRVSIPVSKWRTRWSLGWTAASMVLSIVSIVLFAATEETPEVILIWLCSIFALVLSQIRTVRITIPHIASEERLYLLGLVLLLIVTLISRTYKITTLPYNLDGDFADVGLQARALVTGEQQHIFTYGWAAVPMLGYLPPWLTMSIFGTDLTGLNASGVIQGLLIIVGIYLLGRDLFHMRVGLFAAALLTVSATHLASSRQSSYIDSVFFLLFAIYFLLLGIREGRGLAIVISGMLTALCVQMYYSGRLVAFVAVFILLYMLLFRRSWLRERWWTVLLWGIAVLVGLGPMLVMFLRDIDGFMSRTREVFILNPNVITHMKSVYNVDTVPEMLLQQTRHALLMFNYYLDTSTQFAILRPFLDPFSAVLFFLGAGYSLFRFRWLGYASILAWTILGVVIGCLLTMNPPFWPRLLILLPPTALLAAVALDQIYQYTKQALGRITAPAVMAVPISAALIFVGVGVTNWNAYVEVKGNYATPRTRIGRYLAEQPPSTRAYLVSNDFTYQDREFSFLAPGRLIGNLTPEQAEAEIPTLDESTLIILTHENAEFVAHLEERYQDESVEPFLGNSPDEIAFYVFRLP